MDYTTFCGQTKRFLRSRACSTSKTETSAHEISFMLSANVAIKHSSSSAFGLVSTGTFSGPLSADRLTAQVYHVYCSAEVFKDVSLSLI
jgi:hypothetical protein